MEIKIEEPGVVGQLSHLSPREDAQHWKKENLGTGPGRGEKQTNP